MTNKKVTIEECQTYEVDSRSNCQIIDTNTYPLPTTYLQFAIADLESEETDRAFVNAVSNAKRALHFQVDIIADALGIQHTKRRKDFPSKLEFCVNCGIAGKRILKKLNSVRNRIEHDYYVPTKQEAEDYIDVVELFINATRPLLFWFPWETILKSTTDDLGFKVLMEPSDGTIMFHHYKNPSYTIASSKEDEEEYCKWVNFLISILFRMG